MEVDSPSPFQHTRGGSNTAVVHERQHSGQAFEDMFSALKLPREKPLRERKLPPSFFNQQQKLQQKVHLQQTSFHHAKSVSVPVNLLHHQQQQQHVQQMVRI